mmetsp:Transcript_29273/g.61253  ORF Transcript_29273/g.61253 Transcript_29273/m.61253 type:complete len:83 (-) Transcript_29273:236-484(-)
MDIWVAYRVIPLANCTNIRNNYKIDSDGSKTGINMPYPYCRKYRAQRLQNEQNTRCALPMEFLWQMHDKLPSWKNSEKINKE